MCGVVVVCLKIDNNFQWFQSGKVDTHTHTHTHTHRGKIEEIIAANPLNLSVSPEYISLPQPSSH